MDNPYQSHQLRFRQFRKALGQTQAEFAAKLGLTQVTVSAIEKGKQDVTTRIVCQLADLDCNPNWLLLNMAPMHLSALGTGPSVEVRQRGGSTEYVVRV